MLWEGVHDLLLRAKAGDEDAWSGLHGQIRPYLHSAAATLFGPGWSDRSASDLLQDTWLHAWKHLGEFRSGVDDSSTGATLRAWLRTIMRNLHSNSVRAHQIPGRSPLTGLLGPSTGDGSDSTSGGALDPVADGSTPSLNLHREESKERIQQALHKLDPRDRQIVQILFVEEQSMREAARLLKIDESTVRHHLPRILECLRENLQSLQ